MTTSKSIRRALALATLALAAAGATAAGAEVRLEHLTWTELRDRVAAGTTIALVPIGGTEQSGSHLVLGKHNVRVKALAERIAERLGNAVVAPVLAYVPEGAIEPPTQHMRWPGTLTIPEPVFEAVLESTVRSLQRAGLRDVVFLGDHGGYRRSLERVAARLPRVHALPEYYRAATEDFARQLQARGHTAQETGNHGGLADTALALAVDPALVRSDRLQAPRAGDGADGDPRRASAELGRLGLERIVEVSVAAIRERVAAPARMPRP
ncbi:MAG TPA: creatininase family protein [Burkholderiaceae bacterium]|nr:creatininase family protein [Burkholderiaceae bacterium]